MAYDAGQEASDPSEIVDWPPQPGGAGVAAREHPQAESQAVIREVHVNSVVDKSVPLSGEFRGTRFTYDVMTTDHTFAKRLAAEISKNVGYTLEQLGDLDIDF